jgi:hypothetical protein
MMDKQVVFTELKGLLKAYEPPFSPKRDKDGYYDLWSFKPLVIEGRKRNEVFFAGLIIRKDYVGLYYMPIYVDQELARVFQPELLALLKGKSCFHIKKLDEYLAGQIKIALALGFEAYVQRGWI